MSFFIPHRLSCFICSTKMGERVDAARLFYAHPDDVGEIAKHGRAWVHRGCWSNWPKRQTWARSATRLLTNQAEIQTIAEGFVVCRPSDREILLQDTWAAVEMSIPRDLLKEVLAALGASGSHMVTWQGVDLTFTLGEHGLMVTIRNEAQSLESFALEAHTWRAPLERLLLMQGQAASP